MPQLSRERWTTRIGVILAVAGSAVGLGNFLRFPGQAAQNGGHLFVNYLYQPREDSPEWILEFRDVDKIRWPNNVWLPRQDQLVHLLISSGAQNFIELCDTIAHYPERYEHCTTAEQVLLTEWMRGRMKKWNGTDWEAI